MAYQTQTPSKFLIYSDEDGGAAAALLRIGRYNLATIITHRCMIVALKMRYRVNTFHCAQIALNLFRTASTPRPDLGFEDCLGKKALLRPRLLGDCGNS
jgi:hypothetical protein